MMKRDQYLKLVAKYHRDEIVPVYQAAFKWLAIRPDAPTFAAVGAMGQASSLAPLRLLSAPSPEFTARVKATRAQGAFYLARPRTA